MISVRSNSHKITVCLRRDEEGQIFAVLLDQYDPDSLVFMIFRDELEQAFFYEVEISEEVDAHAPEAEKLRVALDAELKRQEIDYKILHQLPQDWEDRA
ncbi:hypothetical protein [Brucella pseudogrignonensis]|uniref:Uncharacterized protein n=1 Tax=Brucella pseudogrignonensis TaxID=419475 RepID=A0ABU1MF23_9HYPH|nr:hypothetical protein [Brucella pseudogrignonensis]MDR6434654.1 hypothetical protein [Brucella pseudogrignonensis]